MFRHFSFLILCFVVTLSIMEGTLTSVAMAAEYTVTPLAFNYNVERRDIISDVLTVTNTTGQQLRLYATVNEVATDGNGVVESFIEPSMADRTDSPTTWIEINRGRIELKPGEKREIPFTVRMNPNTKPGEYSVFIGLASGSDQPEATAKVMAGQAPGTLVNLIVDLKQDQFLRLEKFTVSRFVTEKSSDEVFFKIANPGAVDVIPHGDVVFYNTKGEELATVPVNTDNVPVVGKASTEYHATVPKDLPIGKYKAYLSVEYGEHLTEGIQDTVYFYILPIKQLIIIFVVVLLLAVGLTLLIYKRYDVDVDDHGAESVALYIKEGRSEEVHHDIDLSKKTSPPSYD